MLQMATANKARTGWTNVNNLTFVIFLTKYVPLSKDFNKLDILIKKQQSDQMKSFCEN